MRKITYSMVKHFSQWLRNEFWDFFGAWHSMYELSLNSIRRRVELAGEKIGKKTAYKLFWVAERNKDREGYHVHFLLKTAKPTQKEIVRTAWYDTNGGEKYSSANVRKFNPKKGGVDYILKELCEDNYGLEVIEEN